MARGSATLESASFSARYLDTDDRRLARAGIAWRLRREGRRWIQTLKSGAPQAPQRFEHDVIRPGASPDAADHAGTPQGNRLIEVLRRAHADGLEVGVRFQTEIRRTTRRIRTGGAVVELAFDEGRLRSSGATQKICEIEFELISGTQAAMLALAERWRKRFGLIYDPRSKSERGDRLAQGSPFPPLRKAGLPRYGSDAKAVEAFASVLDECLAQITHNTIALAEGDPALRVDHIHQLRVGIRRLRSALRSFEPWVPSPPEALVDDLRSLFATLGLSRDGDVLESGVIAELAKFGAPPLALPIGSAGPDAVEAVRSATTQRMFLAWITWRAALSAASEVEPDGPLPAPPAPRDPPAADVATAEHASGSSDVGDASAPTSVAEATLPALDDAATFHRNIERRLRRWHRRIVADWKVFDQLDEDALHALRKRIKRQRYAVEFFAPALRRRKMERYLEALAAIQDRMGELNDLFVAQAKYQAILESEPAAWFALGWLAARIAEARGLARPELGQLAKAKPPTN